MRRSSLPPLLPPEWCEDPGEVAKRRTKEVRRKHPRRDTRAGYEALLTSACRRASLTKGEAQYFLTFLLEELADALMRGEVVRIPRLAAMAIVPHAGSQSFGIRFCVDPALRLRVNEELNGASQQSHLEFLATCRSLACMVPSYRRRGATYAGLIGGDRRKAWQGLVAEAGLRGAGPGDGSIGTVRYGRDRLRRIRATADEEILD